MITPENTVLIVIDIQGKLARVVHESQRLIDNARKLITGAKILEMPILLTEQNPAGLGSTVDEIAHLLGQAAISKSAFSCCREKRFMDALTATSPKHVLLAGIETHVCVYQTARDLLEKSFEVEIVADAVSSRTSENRRIALDKMRAAGATITSVEMVLFELLGSADHEKFKDILRIVK